MRKIVKNALVAMALVCGITQVSAQVEFEMGSPSGLAEILQTSDAQGNIYDSFVPNKSKKAASSGPYSMLAGSWFDSGNGPGVLPYQGQWYFSDILGTTYASGYMTSVNYSWSGSFNGWTDVYVYLFILNNSGSIVANANVTGATSGSLSLPAGTIPADYELVFGYIVDKSPVLTIFNGPSFGYVSVNVLY